MSNYNSQLQSNNTDLQEVLELLQTKAVGENLDEEISTQETLLSEQDAKIAELAQVLSEKSSGGEPKIETCTINISTIGKDYGFGNDAGTIIYTTVENGEIVHKRLDGSMTNLSINVVCNSFFIINESSRRVTDEYHGLELLAGSSFNGFYDIPIRCFHVIASAGETASLIIEID